MSLSSIWKEDGPLIVGAIVVSAVLASLATWGYMQRHATPAQTAHVGVVEVGGSAATPPLTARVEACFNAARAVH